MKDIVTHEYYGSTVNVDWNQLIREAKLEASREYGNQFKDWELVYINEYFCEVLDDTGRLIDEEAKVVVRWVK